MLTVHMFMLINSLHICIYHTGFLLKASCSIASTSSEDTDAVIPIKPLKSKINGNIFAYPWASFRKAYVLDAFEDRYGGIVINADKLPRNSYAFASILHVSLSQWKLEVNCPLSFSRTIKSGIVIRFFSC